MSLVMCWQWPEDLVFSRCVDAVAVDALVEDADGQLSLLYWSDEGLLEQKERVG